MGQANSIYARPQLCKEFGINDRTLLDLEKRGLLPLAWQTRHGLQIAEVTEEHKEVLACARVSLLCFDGGKVPLLPCMRFLFLRFLQVPTEFLEFELQDKNIWRTSNKLLSVLYEWFEARIPEELQDMVARKREPKTEQEKRMFGYILDICEIRLAYEHPEMVDGFEFMGDHRVKCIIDAAITARSTAGEVSKFLHETLGWRISPEGLAFYASLFLDLSILKEEDFKVWHKGLRPSMRDEIMMAQGRPLGLYRAKSGLDDQVAVEQILEVSMDRISTELIKGAENYDDSTSKSFLDAIRAFSILLDRKDKISAGGEQARILPAYMETLKLQHAEAEHGQLRLPPTEEDEEQKLG